ncbi:MAG: GNAT family N-acetyltransferase [Proteobacteria bacterium]|nr:GNAT family N-acetyltransferase [Pseudomonadota bacterium]
MAAHQPPDRNRIVIAPADPEEVGARLCLAAYFDLLAERISGVSRAHVPDPDPEADAYRPPAGLFLLARSGNRLLGCVCLKAVGTRTGEVKRLWVDPAARGIGLGRRLMEAIEDAARALGQTSLRLDTNSALIEAIALYRATGWTETAPFGPSFPADLWFAKAL